MPEPEHDYRALAVARGQDPADARMMFAHELIRQTILSRLSRLRRQHLHPDGNLRPSLDWGDDPADSHGGFQSVRGQRLHHRR